MTNSAHWERGSGIGRVNISGTSTMILTKPESSEARLATVDGATFSDLPALIEAADGTPHRIDAGHRISLDNAELLSPVGRPRKVVCVGQNYPAHISEGGRTSAPPHPDLFAKWDNALTGPYADIALPAESEQIDYESELVVVIGRRCRRIDPANAEAVVFGYTAANDGSVRDFQFHTGQRTAGKAWDNLTPIGPVIVPASMLGGIRPDLQITGLHNGEVVQDDRTSSMVYSVPDLLAYITTFMTLEPGDLVLTGTPAGVGLVRTPPRFLRDGDTFEVRIEGIGAIVNHYHAEKR